MTCDKRLAWRDHYWHGAIALDVVGGVQLALRPTELPAALAGQVLLAAGRSAACPREWSTAVTRMG